MVKSKSTKKGPAKKTATVPAPEPEVVTTASKKAAKEKGPKEDLMVFAFRLTKEESAAIHKAAGPGKASKFARTLLVAAAQNDEATVKAILKAVQAEA
jgi:hypothetical protein